MKTFNKVLSQVSKTAGIVLIAMGTTGSVFLSRLGTGEPFFTQWVLLFCLGTGFILFSVILEWPVNQIDWSNHNERG